MLEGGATHVGVATDHVIESFRNDLWEGYKTGEGIDRALWAQFHPLEDALAAMGVVVWAMVELEADDALASAAALAAKDDRVEKICIWTPDKDLAQCVVGDRVVQIDRRSGQIRDAAGVLAKFGVPPERIPDYLALVGDAADGYPGMPGIGAKTAARLIERYGPLEDFPVDGTLDRERALLFKRLATLRTRCASVRQTSTRCAGAARPRRSRRSPKRSATRSSCPGSPHCPKDSCRSAGDDGGGLALARAICRPKLALPSPCMSTETSVQSTDSKTGRISSSHSSLCGFGQRLTHSIASSIERTCQSQKPARSSLVSAKGPSMTVRRGPEKRTRLPSELALRPSPASITPAFTSCSLNAIISEISFSSGRNSRLGFLRRLDQHHDLHVSSPFTIATSGESSDRQIRLANL